MEATIFYLSRFSAQTANRWHEGVLATCRSLAQMPRRCAAAPENRMFDREVRQILYRHGRIAYRILFTISEATEEEPGLVRILRILHGARQRLGQPQQNGEDESA